MVASLGFRYRGLTPWTVHPALLGHEPSQSGRANLAGMGSGSRTDPLKTDFAPAVSAVRKRALEDVHRLVFVACYMVGLVASVPRLSQRYPELILDILGACDGNGVAGELEGSELLKRVAVYPERFCKVRIDVCHFLSREADTSQCIICCAHM